MYNHHSFLQAIQKLTSSTQAKTEFILRIQTRHFNFHKQLTFILFCQATNMICFYLANVSSTYNKSHFCLAMSLNKASLVEKNPSLLKKIPSKWAGALQQGMQARQLPGAPFWQLPPPNGNAP